MEIRQLLEHAGFDVEVFYTADVDFDAMRRRALAPLQAVLARALVGARWAFTALGLLHGPPSGLGAYSFVRARKARAPNLLKPAWLYRSYPADEVSP